MKDFLIVGFGLAGANFGLKLLQEGKTFNAIDSQKETASRVAAGVYNPIVLKRFNANWEARYQIQLLKETQDYLQSICGFNGKVDLPIQRIFHNEAEKVTWLKKRLTDEEVAYFLSDKFIKNDTKCIQAPHDFGIVQHGGKVRVVEFLDSLIKYLGDSYKQEVFDYLELKREENTWNYKGSSYKNIVFCEGVQLKFNPYFNHLPIVPNKGEVLHVELSDQPKEAIYKGRVFLMPWEKGSHYAGATYDPEFKEEGITKEGLSYLTKHLKKFYKEDFKVKEHLSGMRATVPDRRPLIGEHREYQKMFIINGMGSRGTLNGPHMAEVMFNHIYNDEQIPKEVSIVRYEKT